MSHHVARGLVPCVRPAASGPDCRAGIRPRANGRSRTFAPTSPAIGETVTIRMHPSVESVSRHPVLHSHTQP